MRVAMYSGRQKSLTMTVLQPQFTERRSTSMNHSTSMFPILGAYLYAILAAMPRTKLCLSFLNCRLRFQEAGSKRQAVPEIHAVGCLVES